MLFLRDNGAFYIFLHAPILTFKFSCDFAVCLQTIHLEFMYFFTLLTFIAILQRDIRVSFWAFCTVSVNLDVFCPYPLSLKAKPVVRCKIFIYFYVLFSDPALWKVGQPLRTLSCPNTPLTRHPSVEEKTEANTFHQHGNDHTTRQRSWSDCSIKKRFGSKY